MPAPAGIELYRRHTSFSEPGPWADLLRPLPSAVRELREVPLAVSAHFRRLEACGADLTARRFEARMRQVERMLARIAELDPRPLVSARPVAAKLVGHCRTSAVLLTALLREKGIPARARAGFSAYWRQSMRTGHWVTEYWSRERARWLLADGDLDDEWVRFGDLQFDLCDVPRDKFVLAGEAWLLLRAGEAAEESFGEDPDLCGLEYARAQLLRDVACLTGAEVGPFDRWGLAAVPYAGLGEEQLAVLDEVALASTRDDPFARLTELLDGAPGLAAPSEISRDDEHAERFMTDVPDLWRGPWTASPPRAD